MIVLCLDDDVVTLKLLGATITKLGHEPVLTSDPQEALRRLARTPRVEAIVSDWMMPDMDGITFCKTVRSREEAGYVYFIMLTAKQSPEDFAKAMSCGVDDFLSKPLRINDLGHRLAVAGRIQGFIHEMRRLEEFLAVCMYCKCISDGDRGWVQWEEYISRRLGTRFSHGICPSCFTQVFEPEVEKMVADEQIARTAPYVAADSVQHPLIEAPDADALRSSLEKEQ
ncbi:response regulator [Verrucomicrobia bacterium LW23]|nr:response regulator [Verrucomicrobia bacterium LW23]